MNEEQAAKLKARQQEIVERIQQVSVPAFKLQPKKRLSTPHTPSTTPVHEKTDTHWDFLLKEMQWLAADFMSERKRHVSSSKKLAASVVTYNAGAAQRTARALNEAHVKRRKLAAKLSRDCLKWWSKLDRVITYKQKCVYDQARANAMNQQLVVLVKQTEQYTAATLGDTNDSNRASLTIEQVLEQQPGALTRRKTVQNYARLLQSLSDESLYGESTADDDSYDSSDASWSEESDDESTMRAAEDEETRANQPLDPPQRQHLDPQRNDADFGFVANAVELHKLLQEGTMAIDDVLERLRREGAESIVAAPAHDPAPWDAARAVTATATSAIPGSDADDDMDASDVEDYPSEMDDEFVQTDEPDDETTLEQEEQLPPDMTAAQEIALLNQENELSVDELRERYRQLAETMEQESPRDPPSDTDGDTVIELDAVDEAKSVDGEHNHELDSMDGEDDDADDDYVHMDQVDDETTLEAEERLGRDMSAEEELALLQRESEMSVDELRAMYAMADTENVKGDASAKGAGSSEPADESADSSVTLHKRNRSDESSLDANKKMKQDGDEAMKQIVLTAETAWRTRASRPFLIPSWVHLREYQQLGLNWLVSLQTRRLNGILADEMGLGKTLQTIALLAYLAAYKGIWGPHLIVVPTSVILNWETELKRFCPALKVLCYYGSAKRRKELRTGWTKSNWHHVVITSYQLVVQDAFAFKRKRWYYLVLDEAQHIKNFQSQRWQTLISFNTQRRLLLTGTPLQNNLMELWSLLHFLMPYVFRSRKEFSYWFANPMNNIIEGSGSKNDDVIHRLHGIIRPFVLRRLKKDVETQMPGKFEHIVKCHLSRRQMLMYEEFMARSSTRQALKGGNFMGMMNVLMQLRKVCNHPDLFEPRSVVTPLVVAPVVFPMALCVLGMTGNTDVLSRPSDSMLSPLWSGSRGAPSMDSALRHDEIESRLLRELEAPMVVAREELDIESHERDVFIIPELRALAEAAHATEQQGRAENAKFLSALNSRRCRAESFVYSSRLIDAFRIPEREWMKRSPDILKTPTQLIALRRDQMERAEDVRGLIKRFVMCIPKAGAQPIVMDTNEKRKDQFSASALNEVLLEPLQECLRPFRRAQARLTSFFPDKELVQFDAGKLQALAELLRERKRGGHKVLIFTQMSKMLDILEAFLNMNGHTYVRLDGGTSIDQRQRLMDRFNNDPKIFCFILSTRSGGTGVNLTGADTVVFYDSDWNPAIDAQAQDRAHRIGQTREVHIFRLITEHTIEENILLKAKQKRNLDILIMDKGNFNASQLKTRKARIKETASGESDHQSAFYTTGGLRAILGVNDVDEKGDDVDVSNDQLEKTMTSLEDADDANALRGARKEAAEELQEFDEAIEYKKDSDAEDDDDAPGDQKKDANANKDEEAKSDEKELEKEFAAWQDKVGMDASAIEATLSPVERYCMRYHENIDPFYSVYAVLEYQRKMDALNEKNDEIDIDSIEKEKAMEEQRAFEDGELLCTFPRPEDLIRQRNLYYRERRRIFGDKKRRKLTGDDWERRIDEATQHPYWYNIDTGEAVWDMPKVLVEMESYTQAYSEGWTAIPIIPLVLVMGFLLPFPDRTRCSEICSNWRKAARHPSFVRHVYPVEQGAYTMDESKIEYNHYRTIEDALAVSLPGDTIELADGHYWQNSSMIVTIPLRLIGDEHNPSNVVIEMSGTVVWSAAGGYFEGVSFRRPKLPSGASESIEMMRVESTGALEIFNCVFNNDGNKANVVTLMGPGTKGRWESALVQHGEFGLSLQSGAQLNLVKGIITKCERSGAICENGSILKLLECKIVKNAEHGIVLKGKSRLEINSSRLCFNGVTAIKYDVDCQFSGIGNAYTRSTPSTAPPPPGFQLITE